MLKDREILVLLILNTPQYIETSCFLVILEFSHMETIPTESEQAVWVVHW